MIAGPEVHICNGCAGLCNDITVPINRQTTAETQSRLFYRFRSE